MFNSVMVAVDGSDNSRRAVEVAADLAVHYDARLTVAHALAPGPIPSHLAHMAEVEHLVDTAQSTAGSSQERVRYAVAERVVEEAREHARRMGVLDTSVEIVDGRVVEALLECARGSRVDIMVMGSRGLSEVKGLLLGSVSHQLCQLADCTCVTVK